MPDYMLRECRAAARWVADVVREGISRCDTPAPPKSAVETLECNLIRYFQGCMISMGVLGSNRDSFGGELFCMNFPLWRKYLRRIAYVIIEPGVVAVRIVDEHPCTIEV